MSDPEFTQIGPDAPLARHVSRIAHAHTTDKQRGARVTEFHRLLPDRFETESADGRDRLDAELTALVEDGILTSDDHDGTTYYRLASEVNSG